MNSWISSPPPLLLFSSFSSRLFGGPWKDMLICISSARIQCKRAPPSCNCDRPTGKHIERPMCGTANIVGFDSKHLPNGVAVRVVGVMNKSQACRAAKKVCRRVAASGNAAETRTHGSPQVHTFAKRVSNLHTRPSIPCEIQRLPAGGCTALDASKFSAFLRRCRTKSMFIKNLFTSPT